MSEASKNIQRIHRLLAGSVEHAKPLLKNLHPTDIARVLEQLSPESQEKIIRLLPTATASEVLSEMDEETTPWEILARLSPEKAAELIEELDPDDAADLLAQIPRSELRLIFERISDEEQKVIQQLMTYEEDSAGGIMNPEVLKIQAYQSKREAIQKVISYSEEIEDFYAIYVVDDYGQLLGVVGLKDLIRAQPSQKVINLVRDDLVKVHVDDDQEEAARKLQQYNLPTLPVVDDNNVLLGRITFDDVMDVLQEENTEDLLKIAGVSEDESLRGGWVNAVKSRLPWLLINLVTASTAGFVISRFQNIIEALVAITAYMPVIAGVAGNGATQTLAVTVRRLATENITNRDYLKIVRKEVTVGMINGLIIGAVVSLIAYALNQNPILGLVVFSAMVGNLLIAGFAGSAVPLLLQRLGVDPAVASSILITAFTDILGYTLLLGLGSWLLL